MNEDAPSFRVRRWLESEDFRRLLKVAKYVGREAGASVYALDISRIRTNGYGVDDVLLILDEVGADYGPDLVDWLEKKLESRPQISVTLSYDGKIIYLRSSGRLGDIYTRHLKDILRYERRCRAFVTLPYKYVDTVMALRRAGVTDITDLTGLDKHVKAAEGVRDFEIRFTGELRDYQEEALKRWLRNKNSGIIALPTGAGKTIVGAAAIAKVGVRTLVVAATKEQVRQWREKILQFTDATPSMIGLYYSDEKRKASITITTYQSATKKLMEFVSDYPLLIIDEVHHLPAKTFKVIATGMPSPFRMGLSATPEREDGEHERLFPLMGGIIYYVSPATLAEKGYLAKYEIKTIKVELTPQEKKRYNELRRKYRALVGSSTFEEVLDAVRRGDKRAREALRVHQEMIKIAQQSEAKVKKAIEIINEELERGSKIIVFAQYVDLAKRIATEVGGFLLTGSTEPGRRKIILERFRRVRSGVLVVTTVGDEGIDIPDASVGIIIAGTGSRRQFIQRLGRLLRPAPGKVARLYEIISKGTSEEHQSRRRRQNKLI